MNQNLTRGNITKTILLFALPMMAGNLLQQFYNITDTFIVGKFLGKDALAAVGSAYTLMTFLTSILLGLSMGNGVFVSICFGKKEEGRLKTKVPIFPLYCRNYGHYEYPRLCRYGFSSGIFKYSRKSMT